MHLSGVCSISQTKQTVRHEWHGGTRLLRSHVQCDWRGAQPLWVSTILPGFTVGILLCRRIHVLPHRDLHSRQRPHIVRDHWQQKAANPPELHPSELGRGRPLYGVWWIHDNLLHLLTWIFRPRTCRLQLGGSLCYSRWWDRTLVSGRLGCGEMGGCLQALLQISLHATPRHLWCRYFLDNGLFVCCTASPRMVPLHPRGPAVFVWSGLLHVESWDWEWVFCHLHVRCALLNSSHHHFFLLRPSALHRQGRSGPAARIGNYSEGRARSYTNGNPHGHRFPDMLAPLRQRRLVYLHPPGKSVQPHFYDHPGIFRQELGTL